MRIKSSDIETAVIRIINNSFVDLELLVTNKTLFFYAEKTQSIQMITKFLEIMGPSELILTSYSVSDRLLNFLLACKNNGLITRLTLIIDWKVKLSNASLANFAQSISDDFGLDDVHAKLWLFKSEKETLSVVSSQNINHNPRKEAGTITKEPHIHAYYEEILLELLNRYK